MATAPTTKLGKGTIEALQVPQTGSSTTWDSEIRGFGVRVYAGGTRSFFLNYRVDGRERRYTIGGYPLWSTEAARRRAKELRKYIDAGLDPARVKREQREAPTVQDLIERYTADHLPTKSAKGREND